MAYVDGTWEGDDNISTFFRIPLNASQLSSTNWTSVTTTLALAYPYPTVELRGYLMLEDGRTFASITLDSIRVVLRAS